MVCVADRFEAAHAAASAVAGAVRGRARSDLDLLGPAALFRLRGRERVQVVVKTTARAAAVAAVGAAVERAANERAFRDVAFSVDVDPQ